MTTIAFDGTTLAADRVAVTNGCKHGRVMKLRRYADGRIAGGAGYLTSVVRMLDWLDGRQGAAPDCQQDEKTSADMLEIMLDGRVIQHEEFGSFELLSRPCAVGSGAKFAMGAMLAGCDARRAVEIACELDDGSAGPVDVLVLGAAPARPLERARDASGAGGGFLAVGEGG